VLFVSFMLLKKTQWEHFLWFEWGEYIMFTLWIHIHQWNTQHRPVTDLLRICRSTPVHVFQTTADSTGIRLPGKYRKDNVKTRRDLSLHKQCAVFSLSTYMSFRRNQCLFSDLERREFRRNEGKLVFTTTPVVTTLCRAPF